MKVHELIATLLTLPQEANVYTEQYNSNAVAQVAVNRDENYVLIGDDLDSLIEGAPTHMNCPTRVENLEMPVIYVVHLTTMDEGVPYHFSESYSTPTAARASFKIRVEEEKRLRAVCETNPPNIHIVDKEEYFSWTDDWTRNASEIWIQEEVIWDKPPFIDREEESKGE